MFLVNSRHPHFTATPASSRSKSHHQPGRTFSRSYGAILPSSLTRVLSSALVYSTCPPVLVCGTVTNMNVYEDFPGSMESTTLCPFRNSSSHLSLKETRICQSLKPTCLNRLFQQTASLSFSVPPYTVTPYRRYRNINLFPIDYAFQPRLRGRLTLGRLT